MEIAALIILGFIAVINLILQISNSLLLIKIFEIFKNAIEDKRLKEEADATASRLAQLNRDRAGLVDLATEQANYPLRIR